MTGMKKMIRHEGWWRSLAPEKVKEIGDNEQSRREEDFGFSCRWSRYVCYLSGKWWPMLAEGEKARICAKYSGRTAL